MREIELPTYASSIMEFTDGGEIRLALTDVGTGTKIKLEYINRTAQDVFQIVSFFTSTRGSLHGFFVPVTVWRHPETLKNALESLTKSVIWRFANAPDVRTVRQNVYSFTVELIATSTISPPPTLPFPDQIL